MVSSTVLIPSTRLDNLNPVGLLQMWGLSFQKKKRDEITKTILYSTPCFVIDCQGNLNNSKHMPRGLRDLKLLRRKSIRRNLFRIYIYKSFNEMENTCRKNIKGKGQFYHTSEKKPVAKTGDFLISEFFLLSYFVLNWPKNIW